MLDQGIINYSYGGVGVDTVAALITVFVLGVLDVLMAVPAGILLELNPYLIFIASSLGGILGTLVISILGENIRNWFLKWRYGEDSEIKRGRIYYVWDKYGVIGLGLLSPVLLGAPLTATLGIALGAEKWRLSLWISIGILLWSAGLTAVLTLGIISLEGL
jgi:hypothetical protein